MQIGNVKLSSNIMFAPIAGFSDAGFRHLCAKYGAALTFTELVSAKGLIYNNPGTEALLAKVKTDSPCAVQLFGSDPSFIYRAAADPRLDKFDIIDINMGCPVRKVFCNGDGSALLKDPALIEDIVRAAAEGGKRPVTVKIRAGITVGEPLAVQAAVAAERGGANAITVHPRYREQFYSGVADHTLTRAVKEATSVPVIANGDITSCDSLRKVAEISGADGFMIARGALGTPYIFSQLLNKPYTYSAHADIYEHIKILLGVLPERTVANQMKTHLCHYAKGLPFAKTVRLAAGEAKSLDDIYRIADVYFKDVYSRG